MDESLKGTERTEIMSSSIDGHCCTRCLCRDRLMPYSTFRLVTPAYNADFDGDEQNVQQIVSLPPCVIVSDLRVMFPRTRRL
ncbi:hypothetical protein ACEPAG_2044 [Sanghuangporus baumii]